MIKIVTDSTADISPEMASELNIDIVPLKVCFNDCEYLDGVTLGRDEFYKNLVENGISPKTSQPTPNDYLTAFEKVKEAGDECICITISSALSGTYSSAMLAKKMVDYDKIYIVDSLTTIAGMKILVNQAHKRIEEGKNVLEIVEEIEELKGRIHIVAALSTLEYLKRGGRISSAAATIGSLARIKPIVTINVEGSIDIFAKAIGYQKAINIILEELKKADTDYPIYPVYTYGTDNLQKLISNIDQTVYPLEEAVQAGPTVGTHVGPEVFALVFVGPKR